MKIKFKYGEYDNCSLRFNKHLNGTHALSIFDEYGNPLINVTKCRPDLIIESNQLLVKNYAENEGILENLVEHGIIADTGVVIPSGYVELNLCVLLVDPETYKGA